MMDEVQKPSNLLFSRIPGDVQSKENSNPILFRIQGDEQSPKNPVIPNVIHHRQNPLESTSQKFLHER
jgi:hypothetical protein